MQGKCELCGKYEALELHHIYGGARRKISDKYGAVIYLCHNCHNEPPKGVHFNKEIRLQLQAETQEQLMDAYGWTVEEFRQIFGKSYIY